MLLVVATIIWLGYPIAFETLWRGRTPGKAALGLRVLTKEGAPIRFRHALVRGILGLVDVWLFSGSVGVITILVSRNEQRFGDMAAGTIVVRERSGARAPAATVFAAPAGCEGYVANLDVSGVAPAEYEAARAFLLRAGAMGPAARTDLAARLAVPMAQRLRHTPPPWMATGVVAGLPRRRLPAPARWPVAGRVRRLRGLPAAGAPGTCRRGWQPPPSGYQAHAAAAGRATPPRRRLGTGRSPAGRRHRHLGTGRGPDGSPCRNRSRWRPPTDSARRPERRLLDAIGRFVRGHRNDAARWPVAFTGERTASRRDLVSTGVLDV